MPILRNGKNTATVKVAKPRQQSRVCDGECYKKYKFVIDGTTWNDADHYVRASMFYIPDSPQHMEYYNIIQNADGPNKIKLLVYQDKGGRYTKDWVINKETDKRNVNDVIETYKHLEVRKDWRYVHGELWNKANGVKIQNSCKKCQESWKRQNERHYEFWQKYKNDFKPLFIYA